MNGTRPTRLESTLAQLQQRWGTHVLMPAREATSNLRGIPTSFPALDQLLGTGGVPLNAITLITGSMTSFTGSRFSA